MKVAVACDHGGFRLKEEVIACLKEKGISFKDFGTHSEEAVDYPDFALAVTGSIQRGEFELGILCCGTGIGMSIAANKIPGIRAALCHDTFSARASREHNNANILSLGVRFLTEDQAKEAVKMWLKEPFPADERHVRRIGKIKRIEEEI